MSQYTYVPGDSRLVDHIIGELKSKGIFDQFRKECISDVDTKPAYQNLRMRVEGSVSSFLSRQKWKSDINKNQLREKLRKHIIEANYLEQGVERIVDQVVNPKIASVFMPQVEDLVYSYLGIQKPKSQYDQSNSKELSTDEIDTFSLETINAQEVKLDVPTIVKPEEQMEIDEVINDKNVIEPVAETVKDEVSIDNIVNCQDSNDSVKFEAKEDVREEFIVTTELSNLSLDIPLPDDPPKMTIQEDTSESKRSDTETSLDSTIVRNVSPLTPIHSFNNENSCDAQPAFEESSKNTDISNEKKTENPIPISTFRFTIEKDCQNEEKIKKVNVETAYKEHSLDNYNPPVFDDSSCSNNLHIDYHSDKDATTLDSKVDEIKGEIPHHSNDEEIKIKESQDEKKKSHKSSHGSRDSHRHTSSSKYSKDHRSDSKHRSDKRESSKSDRKSSRDESSHSKSRHSSHGDKSKERSDRDKKDSSDKKDKGDSKDRSHSSHRSSSSKDHKSRHSSSSSRHHSSSSKTNGDKKTSSSRDEKKDGKDHNSSKSKESHSKSSHKSEKDKKSSSTKDKENKKDEKKDKKSTDDHYSASGRGNRTRRSTDRDSNDGNSGNSSSSKGSTFLGGSKTARTVDNKSSTSKSENQSSGSDSTSQSDSVEALNNDTNDKVLKPVIQLESKLKTPIATSSLVSVSSQVPKKKPMIASNMTEAIKLMKVRKQMAAEEEKKRQAATLLIEFQEKIHSSISQAYSGICGPELEFTCFPKYSTAHDVTQVIEKTEETDANNSIQKINDEIKPTENKHTVTKENEEIRWTQFKNSDGQENNENKSTLQQNSIVNENLNDEDHTSQNDEYLNIVCGSPITEMDLKYYTQQETYNAELERDRFRKYLDGLETIDTRKTIFLLNSDFEYEQAVEKISEERGNLRVVNFMRAKPKLQPSVLSSQEFTKSEVVLPNPVKEYSDNEYYSYHYDMSSESETTTEYEMNIDDIIHSKSRKDVMEIILGGMCMETPTVDDEMQRNIPKRKADCLVDECGDNNNHKVLMPMKIRRLSITDQISSTTGIEVNVTPNNFKSKFVGKSRRVGLPKPKCSPHVTTSPLSDKSVENYDQNEQVSARVNGTVDGKGRRGHITQRYDASDLYKPKLHYLSKRHSHVT